MNASNMQTLGRTREAFGVRGACSRFYTAPSLTKAPASWTHSKRFAQYGAPRLRLIAWLSALLAVLACAPVHAKVSVAPEEMGEASRWVAAKFKGVVASEA